MDAQGGGADAVLVLVDDPVLLHSIRRVAAAADRSVIESKVAEARQAWGIAPVVILDVRSAEACRGILPRRRRVVLLCEGPPDIAVWQVATSVGVEHVLAVPQNEAELVAVLGEQPERPDGQGSVVAVLGGCGGSGASSMAAAVALASATGPHSQSTLLLDTDVWGSGSDVLLGIEDVPGLRWSGLSLEGGRISAESLRDALPARGALLRVLACSRSGRAGRSPTPAAARAVIDAGRHAGDLVVCDTPRFPGTLTEAVLELADLVVLVVPATVRACLAATQVARWATERNPNLGLVVRGPAPGGLRGVHVAEVLGLPLIAAVRAERALQGMLEHGGLRMGRRSALSAAARAVLATVDSRPTRVREWAA